MVEYSLKMAVNNCPIIVLEIDLEGNVLTADGGGILELGLEPASIINNKVSKFKKLPIRKSHLKKALQGANFSATSEIDKKIYETFYIPIKDDSGATIKLTTYTINVTARVENEIRLDEEIHRKNKELRDIQVDLKEILQNTNQGIVTFDQDLKINKVYSDQTGSIIRNSDNLEGLDFIETIFKECTDAEKIKRKLTFDFSILFNADSLQWLVTEATFPKKLEIGEDEESRTIKTDFVPIYDDRGMVSRILLSLNDISELTKVSKEAKAHHQKLEKINDILSVET